MKDTILKWHLVDDKPEVHRNVVVQFSNDCGFWFAAGIIGLQANDTMVFFDVIHGGAYNWEKLVMRWAYLDPEMTKTEDETVKGKI